MIRALLLLAALAVSTQTASAQIGGLLNRARAAVTGHSPSEAPAAAEAAEASAAAAPATVDGRPAPAMDFTRFLDLKYWPLRGMYYLGAGTDHLLFPPEGIDAYATDHGAYVIRDASGEAVAGQKLGSLTTTASAAFVRMGTYAGPMGVETLAPGEYTLDLVFRGHLAGRIPFGITAHESGDPFDPKTVYRRSGPWSRLAYFEHETEKPDYHLTFNAWVSAEDLGADTGRVRFTLYRDGQPVATSRKNLDPHVSTEGDWGTASTFLVTPDTREATNSTFFTVQDVTPGSYVMRVTHLDTGETIREYPFEATASGPAPHARSAMDHEPRHEYLTPRRIGGSALNRMYSVFWVETAE